MELIDNGLRHWMDMMFIEIKEELKDNTDAGTVITFDTTIFGKIFEQIMSMEDVLDDQIQELL